MINISSKDKSFLLLIALCIILLWTIISIFFTIYDRVSFKSSQINKIISVEKSRWLNVIKPLSIKDLNGKIIILNFWSSSCVSCFEATNKLKELNNKYPNSFVIFGVHSPIFKNEGDYLAVKKSIIRYDIDYPVINDFDHDLFNKFNVKKIPTFLIFSLNGKIYKKFEGIDKIEQVIKSANNLYHKNKFSISASKIPILSEKYNNVSNILTTPGKIIYVNKFPYKNREISAIIIANSGQNSILITNMKGEIITKIGSGFSGFKDGDFNNAKFLNPQSIIYNNNKIYIADTGNNSIRVADIDKNKVETLIGSGFQGEIITSKKIKLTDNNVDLFAPTDLEFYPDNSTLMISNSGTNQILAYNLKHKEISIFAGNGEEGSQDGVYPENSLSQTSDMSVYGNKLYFIDALSSNLRVIDQDGILKTLYNSKNDKIVKNRLQNPRGLLIDDTGAYISDSLSHAIKKFDFKTNQLTPMIGGQRGNRIGSDTFFDEPNGLFSIIDKFYISDSNNNRIIKVNRVSKASELIDIIPRRRLNKETFLEYLPNLQKSPDITIKANRDLRLLIKYKENWKINPLGPSFINLLELKNRNSANLISNYDWNDISNNSITIGRLKENQEYLMQGKIYFCENTANALCYVKSYEQKIIAKYDSDLSDIIINIEK